MKIILTRHFKNELRRAVTELAVIWLMVHGYYMADIAATRLWPAAIALSMLSLCWLMLRFFMTEESGYAEQQSE